MIIFFIVLWKFDWDRMVNLVIKDKQQAFLSLSLSCGVKDTLVPQITTWQIMNIHKYSNSSNIAYGTFTTNVPSHWYPSI